MKRGERREKKRQHNMPNSPPPPPPPTLSSLEIIKADVTNYLTSEKPLQRELAEAWYEVWESR